MNKYEQRSKDCYDKKAKKYASTFDGKFTEKFKEVLLHNVVVKQDDTVVDIACGNGRFLKMLSEKGDFIGYGVDISDKMIEQAKLNNPEMCFSVAGCDKLPFSNEEIEVMTVCAAYHHFPNVDRFAKEANRVIKKDGMIYIAEVYLPAFLRTLFNPFIRFSKAGDVKFYSTNEIIALFESNGFVENDIVIDGKVQMVKMQKVK